MKVTEMEVRELLSKLNEKSNAKYRLQYELKGRNPFWYIVCETTPRRMIHYAGYYSSLRECYKLIEGILDYLSIEKELV